MIHNTWLQVSFSLLSEKLQLAQALSKSDDREAVVLMDENPLPPTRRAEKKRVKAASKRVEQSASSSASDLWMSVTDEPVKQPDKVLKKYATLLCYLVIFYVKRVNSNFITLPHPTPERWKNIKLLVYSEAWLFRPPTVSYKQVNVRIFFWVSCFTFTSISRKFPGYPNDYKQRGDNMMDPSLV